MKYTLRPHQQRAYQNITKHLPNKDRLQYISACGTGKTLVGFNLIQDLLQDKDKTIVLFFPSLALIKQTYEAYLEYGLNKQELDILFVCSDETVYCGADEECIEISKDEVPFQVTTDTEQINLFLESDTKSKIIFSTYHSSKMLSEGFIKAKKSVDFALYDEAHKTASNNDSYYNYSLEDDNLKISKRLFMTATPKHKNILDKDNDELLFSMNNPTRYGDVVEQYSVRKAIDEGVVAPYKIIVSIVDEDEVEKIRAKNTLNVLKNMDLKKAAKIIALSKSVEKYNIKKGLVFAERIDRSKEYAMAYDELMPGFNAHLDSRNTTQEIYGAFEHLKESSKAMLFNATLLSEGIDVPSVDLVAFMEKTESSINIAQRIGRATRLDPNNTEKIGYIFIPIFLSSPDEDIFEAALKSGDFNEMLEILNVMAEQDEILYSVFSSSRKDPEGSKRNLKKFIEINDFTNRFNISEREYLREKIESITLDRISSSWDKNYELLKEYYEEFGEFPTKLLSYKNIKLGIWLFDKIRCYNNNTLSQERIKLLDDIDKSWKENRRNTKWMKHFNSFKNYYKIHKRIPRCIKDNSNTNIKLDSWISAQRDRFRDNTLSQERIKLLDDIDKSWKFDSHELVWMKSYDAYKEYYNFFKKIPRITNIKFRNIQLGNWLLTQRRNYHRSTLSQERIKLLDDIDKSWKFDTKDLIWDKNYKLLTIFYEKNNTFPKATYTENGINLGSWFHSNKEKYKKGKLSQERIKLLDDIDKSWCKDQSKLSWENHYNLYKSYYVEHSSTFPPLRINYKGVQIGSWLSTQKEKYKKGKLSQERIKLLDDIDKSWKENRRGK